MGIVSPHLALAGLMYSNIHTTGSDAIAGVEGCPRAEAVMPQNQDSTRVARRQTGPASGPEGDVDATGGTGIESNLKDSKSLNTTPIVWMCIVIIAVVILIIVCVLGNRRQNKRDELAGRTKNDEERRLSRVRGRI
jgi:hypothetical protein